jgi:hypothetical protein
LLTSCIYQKITYDIFINMKIIISENQVDKIRSKIHEYVKKYGIEKSREIFGNKVLFIVGFNNDPMEFLNLFNDLDVVQSVEQKYRTLFRYEKGENLMLYDRKLNYVYIDSDQIWSVLQNDFGFNYDDTRQLIEEWLGVVYNLRGVRIAAWQF